MFRRTDAPRIVIVLLSALILHHGAFGVHREATDHCGGRRAQVAALELPFRWATAFPEKLAGPPTTVTFPHRYPDADVALVVSQPAIVLHDG
jgi:hypothetical protein